MWTGRGNGGSKLRRFNHAQDTARSVGAALGLRVAQTQGDSARPHLTNGVRPSRLRYPRPFPTSPSALCAPARQILSRSCWPLYLGTDVVWPRRLSDWDLSVVLAVSPPLDSQSPRSTLCWGLAALPCCFVFLSLTRTSWLLFFPLKTLTTVTMEGRRAVAFPAASVAARLGGKLQV